MKSPIFTNVATLNEEEKKELLQIEAFDPVANQIGSESLIYSTVAYNLLEDVETDAVLKTEAASIRALAKRAIQTAVALATTSEDFLACAEAAVRLGDEDEVTAQIVYKAAEISDRDMEIEKCMLILDDLDLADVRFKDVLDIMSSKYPAVKSFLDQSDAAN